MQWKLPCVLIRNAAVSNVQPEQVVSVVVSPYRRPCRVSEASLILELLLALVERLLPAVVKVDDASVPKQGHIQYSQLGASWSSVPCNVQICLQDAGASGYSKSASSNTVPPARHKPAARRTHRIRQPQRVWDKHEERSPIHLCHRVLGRNRPSISCWTSQSRYREVRPTVSAATVPHNATISTRAVFVLLAPKNSGVHAILSANWPYHRPRLSDAAWRMAMRGDVSSARTATCAAQPIPA